MQRLLLQRTSTIADGAARQIEHTRLLQHAKSIFESSEKYFSEHFLLPNAPLYSIVQMFKVARYCNPDFIRRSVAARPSQFTTATIRPGLDVLLQMHIVLEEPSIEFPDHADIRGLMGEISAYANACQNENYSHYSELEFKQKANQIDDFWADAANNKESFPTWVKLAQHFMLLQTSSCAAERVFSRLAAILKRPGMDSALWDYIESVCMLMYNGNNSGCGDLDA